MYFIRPAEPTLGASSSGLQTTNLRGTWGAFQRVVADGCRSKSKGSNRMSPTQSSTDHPDVRPATTKMRRYRDGWIITVIQPHRTIHVVRAGRLVPSSTAESPSQPFLVPVH